MQYPKQYNTISNAQNILFDDDGFIVDSDEQIFDTSSLHGDSLTRHFPLIDSILSILQQLEPGEQDLRFSKIETVFKGLEGIYDYSFSRQIRNGSLVISWKVIDKTEEYIIERDKQQTEQNDIISRHGRYSF